MSSESADVHLSTKCVRRIKDLGHGADVLARTRL